MYCPCCGSNNTTQTICCARCGTNLSAVADLLMGVQLDKAAVADWTGILLRKYYTGRRDTIAGLLLLAGALLIMRVLISTGMPPFIAFLWTCWIFFWGVISLAEGAGKWLASRDQIKVLGYHISKGRIERSGQEPACQNSADQQIVTLSDEAAFQRPAENRYESHDVRSESYQSDRQRGIVS